jgi:dipeptidyl aminopeptidase/acylaminoacyl peptidase
MPEPLPLNRLYLAHSHSEPFAGAEPGVVYYLKSADGHSYIYRQDDNGLAQALTTEPAPSGGIGYGGGTYAVQGSRLVFAAKDGRLYGLDLNNGRQWPISPAYEGVAAPAFSPDGQLVAFIAEADGACNVLLAETSGEQLPVKLTRNPWYAFNPVFSPDGTRLAWMEWDEFDMPWDESRLVVARLARNAAEAGSAAEVLPLHRTALSQSRVSYSSPQFSPDGKWLAYTSDESGWRSLWVTEADADADDLRTKAVRVDTGPGEIGMPDWVPGQFGMRWAPDGQALVVIRRHESRAALLRVEWPSKAVSVLESGYTWLHDLSIAGTQLAYMAGRSSQPEVVVTLDLQTGQETPRATNQVGLLDLAGLVEPDVISWETEGGASTWGIFFKGRASEGQVGPRPLIVSLHGGPTSERGLTWDPQGQFFATRGWHYLQLNHRGGTGFGRGYQSMLNGQWGVVDVEDARSGAQHLVDRGLADPARLVITGHSAGGYTTMQALTVDPDFWAAGVASAGISHIYDAAKGAHRFEANYEAGLIGRLPAAGPRWMERSPISRVDRVTAPILIFHGRQDKVVPVQQSIDFAEAIKHRGGTADLVIFEEEGHSFRREAAVRQVYEKMERFLEKYVINRQR